MSSCLSDKKPHINYPCQWQYKVIGTAEHEILAAINAVVGGHEHTICKANQSSSGKYLSINLELQVHSEDMRNQIFTQLQGHPALRMII